MKKISCVLFLLISALFMAAPCFAEDNPNIRANTHIQDYGWVSTVSDENSHIIIGTTGQAKRLEAFQLSTAYPGMLIVSNAYVQDVGWQGDKSDPEPSGIPGQSKQIEAVMLHLAGNNADQYNIYYRAHVEGYGWLGWGVNGSQVGTTNHFFRLEALEIIIGPKNQPHDELNFVTPIVQATTRQESRHIYLVNKFRQSHGLNCLSGNGALKKVCDMRVMELPHRLSHYRPNGSHYETIVKDAFPNYPSPGGGFIESFISGATRFSEPEPAFNCYTAYPHMMNIMLDPDCKFMSWSGIISGSMAYSLEVFSGLSYIDFADY